MPDDRFVLASPISRGGDAKRSFVSRAGQKLETALLTFPLDPRGKTCADLGAVKLSLDFLSTRTVGELNKKQLRTALPVTQPGLFSAFPLLNLG